MRMKIVGSLLLAGLWVAPALATEVQRSVELDASPEEVWAAVGEVCSIADWHPAIASCVKEEDERTLYRILQLEDGGQLREQILQVDDEARFYTYSILEGPLPVRGYLGTLSVGPGAEDGTAMVIWQSDFSSVGVGEEEAAGIIGGIYDAGLAELETRFAP